MPKDKNPKLLELAETLSRRIQQDGHAIGEMHRFRNSKLKSVFIKSGIQDHYIMHAGGRRETQFNIGYEGQGDNTEIRYGIAFSLKASRTLVNPVQLFYSRIQEFNRFIRSNPERLSRYRLSANLPNGNRHRNLDVQPIPEDWIVPGAFIFIGIRRKRKFAEYDEADISKILEVMDDLYPVYKAVETFARQSPLVEHRISRICWNDLGWTAPSGIAGKSRHPNSFERAFGYGHEEWLFNYESLHNGNQHAYLQSVQQSIQAYQGSTYDLSLFSIRETNNRDKERLWVASIKNVYVLTKKEREAAHDFFQREGLLEKRLLELVDLGLSKREAKRSFEEYGSFNIRFHPQDVTFFSSDQDPKDFPVIDSARYILARAKQDILIESSNQDRGISLSGKSHLNDAEVIRRGAELKERQCSALHRKIQNDLAKFLKLKHPEHTIDLETGTGFGTNIDCYRKTKDRETFYEVKTYSSAKKCIREAIGQLLEYAIYPDKKRKYDLVVVGIPTLDMDDIFYLKSLRSSLGLNLKYMKCDLKTGEFEIFP